MSQAEVALVETALMAELHRRARLEDGPTKNGVPIRWLDAGVYRCRNDHVGTRVLKSEESGSVCLTCRAPLHLTFPEDKNGILDSTEPFIAERSSDKEVVILYSGQFNRHPRMECGDAAHMRILVIDSEGDEREVYCGAEYNDGLHEQHVGRG